MPKFTLTQTYDIMPDGEFCGTRCPLLHHLNGRSMLPFCGPTRLDSKRLGRNILPLRSDYCVQNAQEGEGSPTTEDEDEE